MEQITPSASPSPPGAEAAKPAHLADDGVVGKLSVLHARLSKNSLAGQALRKSLFAYLPGFASDGPASVAYSPIRVRHAIR